jgi:hypothetical protein
MLIGVSSQPRLIHRQAVLGTIPISARKRRKLINPISHSPFAVLSTELAA